MLIFFYLVSELELENGSPSTSRDAEITFVPRSKSSDVLKKESAFCSHDVKRASSHFNSLKQWGKNRLRAINRLSSNSDDTSKSFKYKANSSDIDDFNVLEAINRKQKKLNEKDRKLSQERKPSYSSSERSLNLNSSISGVSGNAVSTVTIPSALPVKLREPSAALRRHRRTGLGNKDEPHSSSGNWSASSESGRTSIGSEITTTTTHPKSSASSTSLNHHLNHPTTSSSGPPSSIISRRRFLNTSASSSMSEGTATPDLQMFDHDEGENSSVYSCDTEGYYTSFHVDSGLKTLKEEDSMTPVHSSMALSSTNSFESSGNQTVLSPENEYELFGKGSTTTSSSAGTVCTAVLTHECEIKGPIVPERKSSLTKLNRSGSSNSSGNLERSYSTSTVGSTLEKGGTIKRNGVLLQKEVVAIVHQDKIIKRIESPDSGNNTSSSPVDSISSPTNHNVRAYSEFECSESSDLECVERTERIRVKTTINTSRIPSMCVITPTPSDDDEGSSNFKSIKNEEIKIKGNLLNLNMETGYATVMPQEIKKEIPRKASPLLPLNTMLGKLRGVLQPLKKSPIKETLSPIYDTVGDYVTIADVRTPIKKATSSNGVYYSNEVLKRNLATVLSGNLTDETEYVSLNELPCNMRSESNLLAIQENEKVDNLNESIGGESGNKNKGALVKLDAQGKVIYSSDSLKRKKGAYTTFSPGPCVKEEQSSTTTTPTSPIVVELEQKKSISSPFLSGSGVKNRKAGNIRPVVVQRPVKSDDITIPNPIDQKHLQQIATTSSESPIINTIKSEIQMSTNSNNNRIPLNPNLTGYNTNTTIRGAYVNIQDAAPLRNGPPVYSPPSPTRAAAILLQQQEGKDKDTIITQNSPSQAPKIVNYTSKLSSKCSTMVMKEDELLSENIDPNTMKQQVKRSNSYRMAAIYADPNIKCDLSQTKESLNRLKLCGSFVGDENGLKYSNISKVVTRSFEHLMEEFTKSTNSIISTDISLNESLNIESSESLSSYPLSVSKIIDLNEFMTDSPFDEVLELPCSKKVPLPLHLASSSPSKVTLPFDSNQHRARFLKDIKQFDTEIW